MVCSSVCLSVLDFVIFQKKRSPGKYSNLSNRTELILLDSLLQEAKMVEIQIATCIMQLSLYFLIHFYKRLRRGLCISLKLWGGDVFLRIHNLFSRDR